MDAVQIGKSVFRGGYPLLLHRMESSGQGKITEQSMGLKQLREKILSRRELRANIPAGRADGFVPLAALAMISFFLLECKVRCRCRLGLWICSRPRVRG